MKALALALVLSLPVRICVAESAWNLPQDLGPSNTSLGFEVDTTWHTVHGVVHEVQGRAWLEAPADYRSIRVEVRMPVKSFDTDNTSRDEEMRESMQSDQFPEVSFTLDRIETICNPQEMREEVPCQFHTGGSLKIRDVEKPAAIEAFIQRQGSGGYVVEGDSVVNWLSFGVEDPSILIARVDKEVHIHFRVVLEPQRAVTAKG